MSGSHGVVLPLLGRVARSCPFLRAGEVIEGVSVPPWSFEEYVDELNEWGAP